MKRTRFVLRSALLWAVSLLNFGISVPILVVLAFVLNPRKHDWLQRAFCRRIVFFAGARVKLVASPGFDSTKTCFFISNHVNLFDPFVLRDRGREHGARRCGELPGVTIFENPCGSVHLFKVRP